MFREYWSDPHFWVWFWRNRVPSEAKAATFAALLAVLVAGGYIASGRLTGATAATATNSGSYVLETTVTRVVTAEVPGRTVVKRVPVLVRRSIVKSRTAFNTVVQTQLFTTPAATRYLTRKVVHYVPVVEQHAVRVNGKTTTVTETHLVPTVKTETLTNVVTNQQTVTNVSTVVLNHRETVVQPVTSIETQTVASPPQTATEIQTETVVQSVTLPPQTVTVTVTTHR